MLQTNAVDIIKQRAAILGIGVHVGYDYFLHKRVQRDLVHFGILDKAQLNQVIDADNIMVIKDGEIAESGNHKRLMDMGGIYHNMVTKRAVSTGWKN